MSDKYIEVSDRGFVWRVPLGVIADSYASYYVGEDADSKYEDEYQFIMEDAYQGIDWFVNNMNWEDVEHCAMKVAFPAPLERPGPDFECRLVSEGDE